MNDEEKSKKKRKASARMSGPNNPMYGIRGKEHPSYGKRHSQEVRAAIGQKTKGTVPCLDIETGLKTRIPREEFYSDRKRYIATRDPRYKEHQK